jgi:hypothetical protein
MIQNELNKNKEKQEKRVLSLFLMKTPGKEDAGRTYPVNCFPFSR